MPSYLSDETVPSLPPPADAVETFVASLSLRSAPVNTIKSYAHDLSLFVRAVPADLSSVTSEAIGAFLTGDGHHSAATCRRRYSTLCAFYRWLTRHEVVEINPMERLDGPIQTLTLLPNCWKRYKQAGHLVE